MPELESNQRSGDEEILRTPYVPQRVTILIGLKTDERLRPKLLLARMPLGSNQEICWMQQS